MNAPYRQKYDEAYSNTDSSMTFSKHHGLFLTGKQAEGQPALFSKPKLGGN